MDRNVKYKSTHCVEVCRTLWSLQQNGQLCDLFLTAGEDIVFAHRTVLAAISPFFLQTPTTDSDQAEAGGLKMEVDDCSGEALRMVIRYAYSGDMFLTENNVEDVLSLCQKWEVESGKKQCQKYKAQLAKKAKKSVAAECSTRFRARKRVRYTEIDDNQADAGESTDTEAAEIPVLAPTIAKLSKRTHQEDEDWEPSQDDDNTPLINIKRENFEEAEKSLTMVDGVAAAGSRMTRRPVPQTKSKRKRYHPLKVNNTQTIDQISPDGESPPQPKKIVKIRKERVTAPKLQIPKRKRGRPALRGRPPKNRVTPAHERPTRCVRCREAFYNKDQLAEHKRTCATCHRCKRMFDEPEECIAHISSNSCKKSDRRYDCDKCNKCFLQKKSLKNHLVRHHWSEDMSGVTVLKCTHEGCNFRTALNRNLQKHLKYTHSETKPVMCDTCGAMSKNEHYLKIHQRTRHSEGLSCDICGTVVKTRQVLKSHKMRQHGLGTPDFLCSQCTYITFTRIELEKHMFHRHRVPLPSGNEGYTCPHCGWKCIQKTSMDDHILRHTAKERNYPCSVCNKTFITRSDLRGHMVSHDPDKKKFKCPHCDYSTAYGKFKLTDHINRIHEKRDYKPWVCEMCNYRTNVKGNLTSHLRKTHKLNIETNQHLISKLEPFAVAHANIKTPGRGRYAGKAPAKTKKGAAAGGTQEGASKGQQQQQEERVESTEGLSRDGEMGGNEENSNGCGMVPVSAPAPSAPPAPTLIPPVSMSHVQGVPPGVYHHLHQRPVSLGDIHPNVLSENPAYCMANSFALAATSMSSLGGPLPPPPHSVPPHPGHYPHHHPAGLIPPAHMNRSGDLGMVSSGYHGNRGGGDHLGHTQTSPHVPHAPPPHQSHNQPHPSHAQSHAQHAHSEPPSQSHSHAHSHSHSHSHSQSHQQQQQPLPLNMVTMQNSRLLAPPQDTTGAQSMYMESIINSLVSRADQM